jgi:beta-1,4-mannosyl-glycoprotein beta-1,4-N-acetylglucosaminyltransferase
MIVCAQCFLNELDLLEIKLNELRGTVDLFIVLESDRTFTGKPKPLYFHDNRKRFSEFNIRHEIISLPPEGDLAAWPREDIQRGRLVSITDRITSNGDIILWVDMDELPRKEKIVEFAAGNLESASLQMDFLAFYFDRVNPEWKWVHPKIHRKNGAFQACRYESRPIIDDAGWHFEFMGERDHLLSKISATSHAEDAYKNGFYQSVSEGNRPGLEGTFKYPTEKLPQYVQENLDKYQQYFLNGEI